MAKQSILWTALPNGYSEDGRSLRISLLVSPRLEPDFDPQLAEFCGLRRLAGHAGGKPVRAALRRPTRGQRRRAGLRGPNAHR